MGRFVQQVSNEDPERIKRVLDAKYRTIGVDKDTLDKQVEEKKEREAAEKARDEWVTLKATFSVIGEYSICLTFIFTYTRRAFAQMSRYYADQLQQQQQEADRLRKSGKVSVEQFRQQNQVRALALHANLAMV